MDRYMKLFVVMSIVYFFVGSFLGFLMTTDAASEAVRFAHIHFNLLGFMSMMIFGVGYFILPRFNARTLKWPGLVPAHFWLANITLVSMVVFFSVSQKLFWASSILQILSISFLLLMLAIQLITKTNHLNGTQRSTPWGLLKNQAYHGELHRAIMIVWITTLFTTTFSISSSMVSIAFQDHQQE